MASNKINNPIQESVLSILGFTEMTDVQLFSLSQKITELVQRRMMLRIAESMSIEEINEFAEILESGREDKINTIIKEKVPTFFDMLAEEVEKVKEELKDTISAIKSNIED